MRSFNYFIGFPAGRSGVLLSACALRHDTAEHTQAAQQAVPTNRRARRSQRMDGSVDVPN